MGLSSARLVIPSKKLTDYLLNPQHPDGGSKARFLFRRGFHPSQPSQLARALEAHARASSSNVKTVLDRAGRNRFIIEGTMVAPDGSEPFIRTVWQEIGPDLASLVTAYPVRDRRS